MTQIEQQAARIEALAEEIGQWVRAAPVRDRRDLVKAVRAQLAAVFRTVQDAQAPEGTAAGCSASTRRLYDLERALEARRDELRAIAAEDLPTASPPLDEVPRLGYFQLVNVVVRHAIVLSAARPRRFIGRAGFVAAHHVDRQEARIEAFIAVLGYSEPAQPEPPRAGYRKELLDGAFGRELITRKKPT